MRKEENATAPCQHRTWRRSMDQVKEDVDQGWSLRQHVQCERCSHCPETRLTHPHGPRRRFRLHHELTNAPDLLRELNAHRWTSIRRLIDIMQSNRFEVQEQITQWAENGWIEVEEVWSDPAWHIERVRLSPLLVGEQMDKRIKDRDMQESQAIQTLSHILHRWRDEHQEALKKHDAESDLITLLERLHTLFEEQERALGSGQASSIEGTTMIAGGTPHQRWIALLRGILELLAHPRLEHERIFSARWLHDSKAFHRERTKLEAFLNIEGGLERIGLVKHTPVVLTRGSWQANCMEYTMNGREAVTFLATPADAIGHLRDMRVDADRLMIVENRTPFELLVQRERDDAQTLYLYGAGFPGHAERELVALWLRAKPELHWFVWTDLDQGGVNIQKHWFDWATQEGLAFPRTYRWTTRDLDLCQRIAVPLTEEKRAKLSLLNHPLAQALCTWGYTAEQEAIIGMHQDW